MTNYQRGYAQAVADRFAADLEQGKAELEYFHRTTCSCTAALRWVHYCAKHGVPADHPTNSEGE